MTHRHHPHNKRERRQLEAAKKEQRAQKESAYVRRRTAELEAKEKDNDLREEVFGYHG
jgi:hypothetical protein